MINTKCETCKIPMQIAETELESGDIYWAIEFSYKTFFFCSEKCSEEYAN